MILYRPVGLKELQLIYEAGLRAFPPRLPEQPIFYPVLNVEYATQIARDWNTKSHSFAGYVTRFDVDDNYISQFERYIVGSKIHEELWVPAEQLDVFNQHIIGQISVEAAYFGPAFQGYIPERFGMKGKDAIGQFILLAQLFDYSSQDFHSEIGANNLAVFLHYAFWQQYDFGSHGISPEDCSKTLSAIQTVWMKKFPKIPLINSSSHISL